jgi:hypothetical protein
MWRGRKTVFRWGPFGPEDFKKHLDQLMDFLKEKLPSVEFIWLTNPMGKYKQFFSRVPSNEVMSQSGNVVTFFSLLYIKGCWQKPKMAMPTQKNHLIELYSNQCCGSGSVCFWASWIRIPILLLFCDFFLTFYLWKMMWVYIQKVGTVISRYFF